MFQVAKYRYTNHLPSTQHNTITIESYKTQIIKYGVILMVMLMLILFVYVETISTEVQIQSWHNLLLTLFNVKRRKKSNITNYDYWHSML